MIVRRPLSSPYANSVRAEEANAAEAPPTRLVEATSLRQTANAAEAGAEVDTQAKAREIAKWPVSSLRAHTGTLPSPMAVDAEPIVEHSSVAVSQGRVYFRRSEARSG